MNRIKEAGLAAWISQKIANGVYCVAQPFLRLSDWFDERAFRAEKRHDRKNAQSRGELMRYEEGLMFDCEANGCSEHHRDHGRVLPLFEDENLQPMAEQPTEVSGHAVTRVRRSIGPWTKCD